MTNARIITGNSRALGKIAINYGYYRYKTLVMILAVILLSVMVQIFSKPRHLFIQFIQKIRQTNLLIRLSCCKPAGASFKPKPRGFGFFYYVGNIA